MQGMPPVNSPDNCVAARVLWDPGERIIAERGSFQTRLCVVTCVYSMHRDYESVGLRSIDFIALRDQFPPVVEDTRCPGWTTLNDVNLTSSNSGDLYARVYGGRMHLYGTIDAS